MRLRVRAGEEDDGDGRYSTFVGWPVSRLVGWQIGGLADGGG